MSLPEGNTYGYQRVKTLFHHGAKIFQGALSARALLVAVSSSFSSLACCRFFTGYEPSFLGMSPIEVRTSKCMGYNIRTSTHMYIYVYIYTMYINYRHPYLVVGATSDFLSMVTFPFFLLIPLFSTANANLIVNH